MRKQSKALNIFVKRSRQNQTGPFKWDPGVQQAKKKFRPIGLKPEINKHNSTPKIVPHILLAF